MTDSTDYHDYVIKDGRLIGEFEKMYQKSAGVPWQQDVDAQRLDVRIAIDMVRDLYPDSICDIGCGLGYFLEAVKSEIGHCVTVGIGCDVSATACQKAKALFPHLLFAEQNIMGDVNPYMASLVTVRGVLWYVIPKLETAVMNIKRHVRPGGHLLVAQNFPPLSSEFYGKDKIPTPEALHDMFKGGFFTVRKAWMESSTSSGNDNWFFGVYKKD
jgi:SAM-dependent methyltransferase